MLQSSAHFNGPSQTQGEEFPIEINLTQKETRLILHPIIIKRWHGGNSKIEPNNLKERTEEKPFLPCVLIFFLIFKSRDKIRQD